MVFVDGDPKLALTVVEAAGMVSVVIEEAKLATGAAVQPRNSCPDGGRSDAIVTMAPAA
jgi:hypothetical protein